MKKILFYPLVFAFCIIAFYRSVPAKNKSPFTMVGWQLHDYNMPKLEKLVKMAPEYGVNFFIFSHGFFRSVEGFLASTDNVDPAYPPAYVKELATGSSFRIIPGWQSDLRHIGNMATAEGIKYYLWVHEFDDIPKKFMKEGRVNMEDPGLYKYLDQRYERLIKAVPGAAGFVLTLAESDLKIFRNSDVISNESVTQRMKRVAMVIYNVLKRHHKQLILRNFFYEPWQMEDFKKLVPQLPDDIIIMSKDMTHEFNPFYPYDPLHGNVGKKRQIIETDLGVEKAWSYHGAYAQVDFLHRLILHARKKKITGLVGRCRLYWDHPFENSHEINLYAFSRFMKNPDLSVDTVLYDWALKHYNAESAPYIASAMKRTEFINHHGRYFLEMWLTKAIGDEWGEYPYYYGELLLRSRYKWSHNPADSVLVEKLYHPDQKTFDKLVAEKEEVLSQVYASIADLRSASRYLTAEQIAPLNKQFDFLLDAAKLQLQWTRAYFSMRMYMDKPLDKYLTVMNDALDKLVKQEKMPGITYGLNEKTGRRYNIGRFVLEMHWRVANRARALTEDKEILKAVRKEERIAGNIKMNI